MSWTDYEAPTADIPLGNGKTGKVRGLNADDLAILLTNHLEPISKAAALYAAAKKDVYTKANLHSFVISCAKEFPDLMSEVISLAADEPSLRTKKIALGVQMTALQEILRLTVEEAGGLGNLSLVLGNLAKGVLSELQLPEPAPNGTQSPTSIGASEKT
jgi:hypothetical protein